MLDYVDTDFVVYCLDKMSERTSIIKFQHVEILNTFFSQNPVAQEEFFERLSAADITRDDELFFMQRSL